MLRVLFALPLATVLAIGCRSEAAEVTSPSTQSDLSAAPNAMAAPSTANIKGIGGVMPAYYDDKLFRINFSELPAGGESANLARNGSINIIYQSDGCMPGGKMFVSVLDAIQGDGFNPLWQEVQVVFPNPSTCQQFTSDNAILAAAASGLVRLVPTTEVYRCSVIGKP